MLHLITRIDPTDEFDKTCFGILNVTQGLINRLKEYREITDRTPKADHVVFDEDCFFFASDDFLSEYIDSLLPDFKAKVEDLNEGDFFATTDYRLARQHVEASIEIPSVTCESGPNGYGSQGIRSNLLCLQRIQQCGVLVSGVNRIPGKRPEIYRTNIPCFNG